MSLETFNQIFFWVFVLTNIVFCALFFWKTYTGYRTADGKTTVIIKAIVSFVIWFIATFVIIVVSAGYFSGHTLEPAEQRTVQLESATVYLISFIIGWILVGAAIIYWISRNRTPKNYGSN